jgi:tripartite-type tricarboxylate transporter receptor subunit TctC
MSEAGLPGFEAAQWYAIFAPAGTPAPILERIQSDLAKAAASPALKENMAKRGAEMLFTPGSAFAEIVRRDSARWERIARETGARAD